MSQRANDPGSNHVVTVVTAENDRHPTSGEQNRTFSTSSQQRRRSVEREQVEEETSRPRDDVEGVTVDETSRQRTTVNDSNATTADRTEPNGIFQEATTTNHARSTADFDDVSYLVFNDDRNTVIVRGELVVVDVPDERQETSSSSVSLAKFAFDVLSVCRW